MSSLLSSSSSLSSGGPVPIPFITVDPHHPSQFIIDPAAAQLLSTIKGRICPIVVAGPYRSGKSTLLNLLLPPSPTPTPSTSSRRSGFAVGSTVQACTKGIWLWGEPIHLPHSNKTLLFLDSEGLGSIGAPATFDVQIFSLSILLSSLFLLNTHGAITESALEQLELVVQMTERVRVREAQPSAPSTSTSKRSAAPAPSSSTAASTDEELSALALHFPDFLWVLRDFALQLEDASGAPITPRQYLDQALQPVQGARSAEKNRIRRVLSLVFPRRDAVPLVRPVVDERTLQRLSQASEKELRPEFLAQMSHLRQRVYDQVKEKTVEGVTVTGPAYLTLASSYLRAMNTGGIPVIHSAWSSVIQVQGKLAVDDAIKAFTAQMKAALQGGALLTGEEFARLVKDARAEAVRVLREVAVGDAEVVTRLLGELEGRVEEVVEREKELNASRGREHNLGVWGAVWKRVGGDRVVEGGEEGQWEDVQARLLKEYNAQAKGEGKEEVMRRLLGEKTQRLMQRVGERRAEERKEAERVRKAKEAAEARAAEAEKEAARLRLESAYTAKEVERVQAERKAGEEEKKALMEERRRLEGELRDLQAESKRQRREHEKEVEELKGRLQKVEAERQRGEKEGAERQRREAEEKDAEIRTLKRQMEEEKKGRSTAELQLAREREELEEIASEMKGAKERAVGSDDRLSRVQGELQTALKEAAFYRDRFSQEAGEGEERSRELESLQRKNKALAVEVQQLRKESEESSREYAQMEARVKELVQLRKEQEQAKERIAQLEAEAKDFNRSRSEIERAGERSHKLEAELERSRERSQTLQTEVDDLRAQLSRRRPPSPIAVLGKRSREEREEEDKEDVDLQLDADDGDVGQSYASSLAPPVAAFRPSTFAGRRSLAPTRISSGGSSTAGSEEPVDPHGLTIPQLKSWLTELNVDFPMKAQKRDFYVGLLYRTLPELQDVFPRKLYPAPVKKARTGE